jgi:hypothetical protein
MNYDYETEQWCVADLRGRVFGIYNSRVEAWDNIQAGCTVAKIVLRFKEGGY